MAQDKTREKTEDTIDSIAQITRATVPHETLARFATSLAMSPPMDILPSRHTSLNGTSLVLAHNAYNSGTGGALMPNQGLTLTELLNIGARGLELDVYYNKDAIRMCHAICTPVSEIMGFNRELGDAFKEINQWLSKNPGEVLVLKLEDYLGAVPGALEREILKHFKTTNIFTPHDLTSLGNWPSIDYLAQNGKRLIFMPQNTRGSNLMFHSDWGGPFKQSWDIGTIAKVRKEGYNALRAEATPQRLVEVGEDRTFLGNTLDKLRSIPFLKKVIPVAGGITKEEIQKLKSAGVNIISLDQLSKHDARLIPATTLQDITDNAYIYIPAAVIAGMLQARTNPTKSKMNFAQNIIIEALLATTLPSEGFVLYKATKDATIAVQQHPNSSTKDRVKAAAKAGAGTTVDTTLRVAGTTAMTQLAKETGGGFFSNLGAAIGGSTAFRLMYEPAKGFITGLLRGEPSEGFKKGIDKSLFGLTNFGNIDEMVQRTAQRWNAYLKKCDLGLESQNLEQQYDQWIQAEINKAKINKATQNRCLPAPFNAVMDAVKKIRAREQMEMREKLGEVVSSEQLPKNLEEGLPELRHRFQRQKKIKSKTQVLKSKRRTQEGEVVSSRTVAPPPEGLRRRHHCNKKKPSRQHL